MSEDNTKDEAPSKDEEQPAEGGLMEDMEEFVLALNHFVGLVKGMDWPEQFNLAEDQQHCFHVFRSFWRQRTRQRRENRQRHEHAQFQGMNEEDVRQFFRRRFSREFFGEDGKETLNIDPEQHQPDEKHIDSEAKERQQRFRDEWE